MTEIWSLGSREDGDFVIIRNLGHKSRDTLGVREMLNEGTRRQGGDVQRTRNAGLETWERSRSGNQEQQVVTAEGEGKDEWLWDGEESKAGPWRIPPNTEGVMGGGRARRQESGGGGDQEGRCITTAKCFLRPPRFQPGSSQRSGRQVGFSLSTGTLDASSYI